MAAAVDSTLTISTATASDNGSYSVIVQNSAGSVESPPCTIIVRLPPAITVTPSFTGIQSGQSASLSVAVQPQPAADVILSYQWLVSINGGYE